MVLVDYIGIFFYVAILLATYCSLWAIHCVHVGIFLLGVCKDIIFQHICSDSMVFLFLILLTLLLVKFQTPVAVMYYHTHFCLNFLKRFCWNNLNLCVDSKFSNIDRRHLLNTVINDPFDILHVVILSAEVSSFTLHFII